MLTRDSLLLRPQLILDEVESMRRLGRDRREASTRLPVLSRTGPLARKPAKVAIGSKSWKQATGGPP
jgi:hypothetical protein